MSIKDIETAIKNVILSFEFCRPGDNDENIFEDIESLNFIRFVLALEEKLQIEFDDYNLHPDNFRTVNLIVEAVNKERAR